MDTPASPSPGDHADAHPPFLAHHFQTPEQQFAAGKLGMWLFLVTEVLLFGGLFCAYAVYRAHHPEIFQYAAAEFLNKTLGAVNTCVLIFSSFTMAWGVRCAQLNQQRGLIVLLSVTLICGFVFLGIKYVEYREKWREGLLWARSYAPVEHQQGESAAGAAATRSAPRAVPDAKQPPAAKPEAPSPGAETAKAQPGEQDQVVLPPTLASPHAKPRFRTEPKNVGVFFSIYFVMTGLHGLHVIAGMAAISWVLVRARKGHFGSSYFGPVDYVGLYWHLVDLIWIYLFPLLYLIH